MKRKRGMRLQLFAGILLVTMLLFFTDLLILGLLVMKSNSVDYQNPPEILTSLSVKNGTYELGKKEAESLLKHGQFAMLLDKDGNISLKSLEKPIHYRISPGLPDIILRTIRFVPMWSGRDCL